MQLSESGAGASHANVLLHVLSLTFRLNRGHVSNLLYHCKKASSTISFGHVLACNALTLLSFHNTQKKACIPPCRPVLHLGGRLDGQARFSKLAYAAQEAAVTAYKVGSW